MKQEPFSLYLTRLILSVSITVSFGLLMVVVGYLLIKPKIEPTISQPSVSPPAENIIKDETEDWKTYRNEEYSYEIKYPSDWRIVDEKPYYTINHLYLKSPENEVIKIFNQNNNKNLSIEQWYKSNFPKGNYEIMVIDDISSVKTYTAIFIPIDNKVLTITYSEYEGPGGEIGKYPELFNQILSTFKFIK